MHNAATIDAQLAAARALPTAYQISVALTDVAERVHGTYRGLADTIVREAIDRTRQIESPKSRAYALRAMVNYSLTMDADTTRWALEELAALHRSVTDIAVRESLLGALVTSRRHDDLIDGVITDIECGVHRAMVRKAIDDARQHDRRHQPPRQAGSQRESYDCATLKKTCTIIYAAAKGGGRRWEHEWHFQWCRSADTCGVRRDGHTDWTRCEHPNANSPGTATQFQPPYR